MNKLELKSLLNEGLFDQLQKAIDYTEKLTTLGVTGGKAALKDELIDKITDFVEKAKDKATGGAAKRLIQDLEDKLAQAHSQKDFLRKKRSRTDFTRARDARGRFIKKQP